MPAKIILHVGTHKTGTTSIQHFCRRNQKELLKQGFLYPDSDLVGLKSHPAHHDISHAIASQNGRMDIADVKNYIEKIKKHKGNVIISAEPFYRYFISESRSENIWVKKERYVSLVSELFGNDADICFVLRNHYDFAKSLYQEKIKQTRQTITFSEFLLKYEGELDYFKNVSLWEKYFNNIHVLDFKTLLEKKDLESAFLTFFGVNTKDFQSVERKNDSLPIELVLFKSILNSMPLTDKTIFKVRERLLDFNNHSMVFSGKKEFDYASKEDIELFYKKYEKSNSNLKSKYPNLKSIDKIKSHPPVFPGLSEGLYLKMLKQYLIN
jgi:hypothetical protein